MNGKPKTGKPRSRSGSATSNSETSIPSRSAIVPPLGESMSDHHLSSPAQIHHHQVSPDFCSSFHEKGAVGDGECQPERQDSNEGPCQDQSNTQEAAVDSVDPAATQSESHFSDPVFQKLSRLNGEINRMRKDQLRKKLAELHLHTGGVKEVLKKRLKNYYRRKKLSAANISKGMESVPYDYLVVIDYEATCQDNNDHFVHEIIEFPAVLVDVQQNKIVGMFREYCKPKVNPVLTEFCKQLTGVKQSDVDSASMFAEVLDHFESWLDSWQLGSNHTFCVVTDGPWDILRFLSKQCELSLIPYPRWSRRWINIRKSYGNFYDTRRLNLNNMLVNLGLEFEGRPHCGLDDSKNIARILCHLLQDGCVLKVNEKLDGNPKFMNSSGCGDVGDENPSGDFKPLSRKPACSSARSTSGNSSWDSCPQKPKSVKELSGLETDEEVSDLLYYFKLQSR